MFPEHPCCEPDSSWRCPGGACLQSCTFLLVPLTPRSLLCVPREVPGKFASCAPATKGPRNLHNSRLCSGGIMKCKGRALNRSLTSVAAESPQMYDDTGRQRCHHTEHPHMALRRARCCLSRSPWQPGSIGHGHQHLLCSAPAWSFHMKAGTAQHYITLGRFCKPCCQARGS